MVSRQIIAKNTIFILLLIIFVGITGYFIYHQITEHYAQMDPMLQKIQSHITPLHPIVESVHFYEGKKSYTINKQKIYLCLKDENQEYYDFNMLIYVAIHEIAHVLCDDIGHTSKFHKIFDELLKKAADLDLYDPSKPIILNYCGHH